MDLTQLHEWRKAKIVKVIHATDTADRLLETYRLEPNFEPYVRLIWNVIHTRPIKRRYMELAARFSQMPI